MSHGVLAPVVVAVVVAVVSTTLHRRVRPRLAAMLLTGTIVGVALTAVPTVVVFAFGFLTHLPYLGGGFEWCRVVLGVHGEVNPWVGAVATLVLGIGLVRLVRVVRDWRGHHCCSPGGHVVVDSDQWFAYSLPGPGRRVAVSSGLVAALDPDELTVVLAHEHAHAHHRHDRHLLVANLTAALVPVIEPLRRRLRFALERWADEAAVAALDGDRERVAFTLARVALGTGDVPGAAGGFSGLGVTARVEALLTPPAASRHRGWSSTMGSGVGLVIVAAAVQAHHLAGLVATLCPS